MNLMQLFGLVALWGLVLGFCGFILGGLLAINDKPKAVDIVMSTSFFLLLVAMVSLGGIATLSILNDH